MKNIIIILIVVLVAGCSLQKKSVRTKTEETKTIETKKTVSDQSVFTIDTTKISDLEATYTKVEYYPPASEPTSTAGSTASRSPTSSVGEASIKAPVKSVETWTVKEKTVTKGETVIQKAIQNDSTSQIASNVIQETEEKTQPAPDPKRWRYIFYILVLCAGAIIYLKRSGVFTWLKSVLSVVRNFLKI